MKWLIVWVKLSSQLWRKDKTWYKRWWGCCQKLDNKNTNWNDQIHSSSQGWSNNTKEKTSGYQARQINSTCWDTSYKLYILLINKWTHNTQKTHCIYRKEYKTDAIKSVCLPVWSSTTSLLHYNLSIQPPRPTTSRPFSHSVPLCSSVFQHFQLTAAAVTALTEIEQVHRQCIKFRNNPLWAKHLARLTWPVNHITLGCVR